MARPASERRVILGYLDDNPASWGQKFADHRVLGGLADARRFSDAQFVNGIGSAINFPKKPEILAKTGLSRERFTNVIHPQTWISPSARLGVGVAILAGVSVCAQATIGDHVIILPNSVVSHDDIIGSYTCITSGVCISGGVRTGPCCYLGTNSSIRGNLTLGACVLVGMGATVIAHVPDNQVVVGSPARFLRWTLPNAKAA
jgi:sugar O-acyltransferase (sialic acid O-acetyltransferase NeuD family)